MGKKLGRPFSLNPKISSQSVRLDAKSVEILMVYCKQEKINKSVAIQRGIKKLEEEIKR